MHVYTPDNISFCPLDLELNQRSSAICKDLLDQGLKKKIL